MDLNAYICTNNFAPDSSNYIITMGNKISFLLLHTSDPMLWKAVETCLRTRYPEAEIRKGKKNESFVLKRTSNERLKIRICVNRKENTTRFTFSNLHWAVRGIRYGMLGVWPTLIFDSDSCGLIEDAAESLGRYLGHRFLENWFLETHPSVSF